MFFLLLVIALMIASSCTKPECKTNNDCQSRVCTLSKCEEGACAYTLLRNCCGNKINESIENGKPGNKCTCPQDYGKCEGKPKIKVGLKIEDAVYLHYYCNEETKCVFGIENKGIAAQNFLDTINLVFFKASSVIRYNKPFDINKDTLEFKITLDDVNKDLVLPVRLTSIKLLFSSANQRTELLIAEKTLNEILDEIGKPVGISLALNLDYRPEEAEETGSIKYSIDYTYIKKVSTGKIINGTTVYKEESVRDRFTGLPKQIFFVRSE